MDINFFGHVAVTKAFLGISHSPPLLLFSSSPVGLAVRFLLFALMHRSNKEDKRKNHQPNQCGWILHGTTFGGVLVFKGTHSSLFYLCFLFHFFIFIFYISFNASISINRFVFFFFFFHSMQWKPFQTLFGVRCISGESLYLLLVWSFFFAHIVIFSPSSSFFQTFIIISFISF